MRDELREIKPGKLVRRLDNDSTLLSPEMTLWEFDFYTFFFFFNANTFAEDQRKNKMTAGLENNLPEQSYVCVV